MAKLFRPVPIEIVCFLCQQSAEKILKAYVLASGGQLIKTHDIYSLLTQCQTYNQTFGEFVDLADTLTSYATLARYPSFDTIIQEDMNQALSDAQKILDFTKAQIK